MIYEFSYIEMVEAFEMVKELREELQDKATVEILGLDNKRNVCFYRITPTNEDVICDV